LYIMYYRSRL